MTLAPAAHMPWPLVGMAAEGLLPSPPRGGCLGCWSTLPSLAPPYTTQCGCHPYVPHFLVTRGPRHCLGLFGRGSPGPWTPCVCPRGGRQFNQVWAMAMPMFPRRPCRPCLHNQLLLPSREEGCCALPTQHLSPPRMRVPKSRMPSPLWPSPDSVRWEEVSYPGPSSPAHLTGEENVSQRNTAAMPHSPWFPGNPLKLPVLSACLQQDSGTLSPGPRQHSWQGCTTQRRWRRRSYCT